MTPKFTIGIPVYNGMPFLPETMESVLKQSYADFEILVINDGSKDDSWEYLTSLRDPRLRLISQQNRGLTRTLNRMLEESRTPWLVRLDADDIACVDRLAHIARAAEQYPEAGMFYSRARHHNHASALSLVRTTEATPQELRALVQSGYIPAICHSSVVLNVCKTLDVGGYRFDLHIEDLDLWWRMALSHDVVFIPEVTVAYRLNNASVCINNLRELSCNSLFAQYLLLSRLWNRSPLTYAEIKPALESLVSDSKLRYREQMWKAAICIAGGGQRVQALKHLAAAAAIAPLRFAQRSAYPLRRNKMIRVGEPPEIFKQAGSELWPADSMSGATMPALDI